MDSMGGEQNPQPGCEMSGAERDEVLMTDLTHTVLSRPLNRTEMQFFTWTHDEREAIALASVCTLPDKATYAQIEDAALKCFNAALEHAGLTDSIEYVGRERRDTLRIVQ